MSSLVKDDAEWVNIQMRVFTAWMNEVLKERPPFKISNFDTDLKDGVLLINIMEILTDAKIKHNPKPKIQAQHIENCTQLLNFIEKQGLSLVSTGPQNIAEGNRSLTLGLVWKLIAKYHIKPQPRRSEKADMVEWSGGKLAGIITGGVKNMDSDWTDGRLLCALVEAMSPGLMPNWKDVGGKGFSSIDKAMTVAEQHLGIPRILSPSDMSNPAINDCSVMTYIAYFREAKRKQKSEGFSEGLYVTVVKGPKSDIRVDTDSFTHGLSYMPKGAGEFEIEITWKGTPIKGSPFTVKTT